MKNFLFPGCFQNKLLVLEDSSVRKVIAAQAQCPQPSRFPRRSQPWGFANVTLVILVLGELASQHNLAGKFQARKKFCQEKGQREPEDWHLCWTLTSTGTHECASHSHTCVLTSTCTHTNSKQIFVSLDYKQKYTIYIFLKCIWN